MYIIIFFSNENSFLIAQQPYNFNAAKIIPYINSLF